MRLTVAVIGLVLAMGVFAKSIASPVVIGACHWTSGRVGLSADDAFVLALDRSYLGFRGMVFPEAKVCDWPKNLADAMDHAQRTTGSVMVGLHGRFRVCPVINTERDRFGLLVVCIRSANRLSIDR